LNPNESPSEPGEEKEPRAPWQRHLRTYIGYALTGLLVFWLVQQFILAPRLPQTSEIDYSEFKQMLAGGQIVTVVIGDSSLAGTMQNPQPNAASAMLPFHTVYAAGEDPKLVEELQNAGVQYSFQRPTNPIGGFLLSLLLPVLLIGGFWFFISRRMSQGAGNLGGMNEQERQTVAYHESGHALVALLTPHGDPVSKISIIPRSRGALGYTMQMPTEDRYLLTLDELLDKIAVMLGGRAAEMVIFGTLSTGASDDILRASELARRMVTEYGMSEQLGSVRYAGQQLQYLGGAIQENSLISPATRQVIDREVQRIVTEQYERAQTLLLGRRAALERLTQQLLKQETVDGRAVKQALVGETPLAGQNGQLQPGLVVGPAVR
jgi:ATP-dependent Zn protease